MGFLSKIKNWRAKVFLWVGLPIIAGMGLFLGITDLVPAWQAKNGDGVVGTFTANREQCGRRTCSFHGSWQPADGSAGKADTLLYDEPDDLQVGGTVEAIDSGARKGVFATAGGSSYLLFTGMTVAGVAVAGTWVFYLYRTFRRKPAADTAQQDAFFKA
jgi:hypothetical protein